MEKVTMEQLPELFRAVGDRFAENEELLCDMDSKMGDGDLGLTMKKGFGALPFGIWMKKILPRRSARQEWK